MEHIPSEGPVLIVFYHAALPIDFYYLFAKVWLYRNRRVRVVADKFVFKIPGSSFLNPKERRDRVVKLTVDRKFQLKFFFSFRFQQVYRRYSKRWKFNPQRRSLVNEC